MPRGRLFCSSWAIGSGFFSRFLPLPKNLHTAPSKSASASELSPDTPFKPLFSPFLTTLATSPPWAYRRIHWWSYQGSQAYTIQDLPNWIVQLPRSSILQCGCGLYVPVFLSYLTLQTPTLIYVTNGLEVNDGLILDQVRRKRTKTHCKQAREGDFVEGWRWELRGWFLWIRTWKGEWMIRLFLIETTSMKTIERRKRWRKQRKRMNTETNDIKTTSPISITLPDAHNLYDLDARFWNKSVRQIIMPLLKSLAPLSPKPTTISKSSN